MLLGSGLFLYGLCPLWRAHQSTGWPTVPGQVISSEVKSHHKSKGTSYGARVEYSYRVADRSFIGNRVAYGDYSSSSTSHARSIVQKYPVGHAVTVRYLSSAPETSVLEPGIFLQATILPLVGLVFLFAGIVFRIYFSRQALI